MTHQSTDSVRRTITVPASLDRAFAVFTNELNSWWPREYTWSEHGMESATIDPDRGCWLERDSDGNETVWGRLLTWEPPRRIVLTWQISPERTIESDPAKASEIDIRFESEGAPTTRLELEHRNFAKHGEGGEAMRAGLESPQGWTRILERYSEAV